MSRASDAKRMIQGKWEQEVMCSMIDEGSVAEGSGGEYSSDEEGNSVS